jgi:hypothetical protein
LAIADRSYRQMMSDQRKSQSILISERKWRRPNHQDYRVLSHHWELETTPFRNQCKIRALQRWRRRTSRSGIVDYAKVLQSNPVLEALVTPGHCATTTVLGLVNLIEFRLLAAPATDGCQSANLFAQGAPCLHAENETTIFSTNCSWRSDEITKYEFHDGLTQVDWKCPPLSLHWSVERRICENFPTQLDSSTRSRL